MYHTSPQPITSGMIHHGGVAGDCLFFSDNIYQMAITEKIYVYEADFDCVPAYKLYDEQIVREIMEKFDVDANQAERLLDARDCVYDLIYDDDDFENAAEDAWYLQGKRGECAVKMGYDGCEDVDEQGCVYIVPMAGRESELKII